MENKEKLIRKYLSGETTSIEDKQVKENLKDDDFKEEMLFEYSIDRFLTENATEESEITLSQEEEEHFIGIFQEERKVANKVIRFRTVLGVAASFLVLLTSVGLWYSNEYFSDEKLQADAEIGKEVILDFDQLTKGITRSAPGNRGNANIGVPDEFHRGLQEYRIYKNYPKSVEVLEFFIKNREQDYYYWNAQYVIVQSLIKERKYDKALEILELLLSEKSHPILIESRKQFMFDEFIVLSLKENNTNARYYQELYETLVQSSAFKNKTEILYNKSNSVWRKLNNYFKFTSVYLKKGYKKTVH